MAKQLLQSIVRDTKIECSQKTTKNGAGTTKAIILGFDRANKVACLWTNIGEMIIKLNNVAMYIITIYVQKLVDHVKIALNSVSIATIHNQFFCLHLCMT